MAEVKNKVSGYMDAIEEMMDSIGLSEFTMLVANVCDEKSRHIQSSYGNKLLADHWSAFGSAFEDIAKKAKNGSV